LSPRTFALREVSAFLPEDRKVGALGRQLAVEFVHMTDRL